MTNQFQNVVAWQKAHQLVLLVYQTTKLFPDFEKFGLCSQFQRAAVSVPANIAEGYRKISRADKLRFYNIAQGSLEECRYYTILSKDLHYISDDSHDLLAATIEETSKTLNAYCKGVIGNDFASTL